jgi:preprotein translocase subunit SecD
MASSASREQAGNMSLSTETRLRSNKERTEEKVGLEEVREEREIPAKELAALLEHARQRGRWEELRLSEIEMRKRTWDRIFAQLDGHRADRRKKSEDEYYRSRVVGSSPRISNRRSKSRRKVRSHAEAPPAGAIKGYTFVWI